MASRRAPQLALPLPSTWGGRRAGAGRKPTPGRRRGTPHRGRPVHKASHPVHLTLRARAGIRSFRHAGLYPFLRAAISSSSGDGFRVLQFSVQADHVHLIVEAGDARRLSSGARGLSIRIARAVNRVLGRKGAVWGDRYHTRALATPREVRHGLVYVLMNARKHLRGNGVAVDPCSSAPWFDGFRPGITRPPAAPSPVAPARTWLARQGWRRHGLIATYEAPREARLR